MPEEEQEKGRQGVLRVKRLLEASMRFKLPYDAYENKERVVLPMLTGHTEIYDLTGDHLDGSMKAQRRIYIESKNVAGAAGQGGEFERFVAQAYSATEKQWATISTDPKWEFMWATTSPWKGDGFREVASKEKLKDAITKFTDSNIIPAGHQADESRIDLLSDRLWVWVICERHEDMSPSDQMRGFVVKGFADAGEAP